MELQLASKVVMVRGSGSTWKTPTAKEKFPTRTWNWILRELPISVHKSITIGPDNWAFRCPTPKDSCQQALSGQVVLDHFEENAGREIPRTDGYYELRFNSGGSESGRFIVDCLAPCS